MLELLELDCHCERSVAISVLGGSVGIAAVDWDQPRNDSEEKAGW